MATLRGETNLDEHDLYELMEAIGREVSLAEQEGYVWLDVGHELKRAQTILKEVRQKKENEYEKGFDPERAKSFVEVKERLLRAKGALIALKLPEWARELYYGGGLTEEKETDKIRGVNFLSQFWALPGSWPGMWYRCNCRPSTKAIQDIEKSHQEGKRVNAYMSGGMAPITYALLPESEIGWGGEESWQDDFMKRYGSSYWYHGFEKYSVADGQPSLPARFWGARAVSSEWGWWMPAYKDFGRWMLSQFEFAARIGLDNIHVDECYGEYGEFRRLAERYPWFVVCNNNCARMYLDQQAFRFGMISMSEVLGHPSSWDDFYKTMRSQCFSSYNIPWWGYLYIFDKGFLANLSFATTLINKGSDVSHSDPSLEYVVFSRRFSDYLYGSYVDIDVSQDIVKTLAAPDSVRTVVNRRVLRSGQEELIVHILNINPEVTAVREVSLEVDISKRPVKSSSTVTLATPESGIQVLKSTVKDGVVFFQVPEVNIWGLVVIGETLFPTVSLRLLSRGGSEISQLLDDKFVPGEEILVEASVKELVPAQHSLDLCVPEGWKCRLVDKDKKGTHTFRVMPLFARKDAGYVITPVLSKEGQSVPSWPLRLQAKDKIVFRLISPLSESPRIKQDHELEVKNNSSSGVVEFFLKPPSGWTVDRKSFKLDIKAGESRRVKLSITTPDCNVKFWDQLDVDFPVEWLFQETTGADSLKIRVFPAKFSVYAVGVEKNIMQGYPNPYFKDSLEDAKLGLQNGEYVALWLVNQDPIKYGPVVDEFIKMGGGVVWMGEPFPGENCPVTLVEKEVRAKALNYLTSEQTRATFEDDLVEGKPLESLFKLKDTKFHYQSKDGYLAHRVKAKDWGKIIATWRAYNSYGRKTPEVLSPPQMENTPAVVISEAPEKRICYIGSDLEAISEDSYHFEERLHLQNQWYQTYIFYCLLDWAAVK